MRLCEQTYSHLLSETGSRRLLRCGTDSVLVLLKIRFLILRISEINEEVVIFFNLLRSQGILGIAESWAGLETYMISGCTSNIAAFCCTFQIPLFILFLRPHASLVGL
jgi:hypothetical protein